MEQNVSFYEEVPTFYAMNAAKKENNQILYALEDGLLRARDLTQRGFSRQRIMRLTRQGLLLRVGRGLYSRLDATVTENHDLAQVGARVPGGVICLVSALQFHQLTTQNPRQVWLLIEKGARLPEIDYPPLRLFRASGEAFTAGVEVHSIEGIKVQVTDVSKTIADCFKYRNKIGLDIALEALRECLRERRATIDELLRYARICRVERILRPYLEAMVEALAA